MCKYYDITSSNNAYLFLLDTLGMQPSALIMEYLVECGGDVDLFLERNEYRLDDMNLHDVRFVAFHVTASLDDCQEIQANGIRDLQYTLSQETMLSRLLEQSGMFFDVHNSILNVDGRKYDINYEHYRTRTSLSTIEECLSSIAHRVYYDFCVNGFWVNDNIQRYGTHIHERPEFISKLITISPKARRLDDFWRTRSKPYKVFFFATLEQIHKFTFDLEKNDEPYNDEEQKKVKQWMLRMAINQAFDPGGEHYIYVRDHQFIPPEQIIKCEIIEMGNNVCQ